MKLHQYCRYCCYLSVGDVPYCERLYKTMSDERAKQPNNCHYFRFCRMDAFDCRKFYKPRVYKSRKFDGQMSLAEFGLEQSKG